MSVGMDLIRFAVLKAHAGTETRRSCVWLAEGCRIVACFVKLAKNSLAMVSLTNATGCLRYYLVQSLTADLPQPSPPMGHSSDSDC